MPSGAVGTLTAGQLVDMTASLLLSAANFRYGVVEKVSFVLLNQLDLTLTIIAVSLGFSEINPFMKYLLAMPAQLMIFKLIVPLFIAWLTPGRLLLPSIFFLCLVVGWDIKEFLVALA